MGAEMDKRRKPNEAEITCRLRGQVGDLETAVSAAKREAIRLFRELDARARKARSLASDLDVGGDAWARRVSRLMDILGDCRETMEGMGAIGLLRGARFSWDVGKIFDGTKNGCVPG
jgi:hypothetical protein